MENLFTHYSYLLLQFPPLELTGYGLTFYCGRLARRMKVDQRLCCEYDQLSFTASGVIIGYLDLIWILDYDPMTRFFFKLLY